MKKSPIDKEIVKALSYIQKNILNRGPLAGMDIKDQIKKIISVLDKWLKDHKVKTVSGSGG